MRLGEATSRAILAEHPLYSRNGFKSMVINGYFASTGRAAKSGLVGTGTALLYIVTPKGIERARWKPASLAIKPSRIVTGKPKAVTNKPPAQIVETPATIRTFAPLTLPQTFYKPPKWDTGRNFPTANAAN